MTPGYAGFSRFQPGAPDYKNSFQVRGRSDWLCGTGLRVRSLNGHGEAVGDRRSVVEADRVAAASPSARHARAGPTQRPEVFAGHPVRALHRYQLEAPATRARLRIRCHLLAAIPPLVRGRSLGPPSPNAALGAARARRDRLVRGLSRRLPCQGQKGGAGTGPSPVDRGRPGSKHHIACDSAGIPLAILTTAGNVPDIKAAQDPWSKPYHRSPGASAEHAAGPTPSSPT